MTSIDLTSPALTVRILTRGATLAAVRFRPDGRNLVLGFANPADHLTTPGYVGALVGPVANRVSDGRVTLNSKTYQMERNENGITALHSGTQGIHAHLWDVREQRENHVTLATTLPDGACGLPGNRTITASYTVQQNRLCLEIEAETDQATPMNVAAHPYWCLDGSEDVAHHLLEVHAAQYTPVTAQSVPTGEILATSNTLFDFGTPKPVPRDPDLDINFCLATEDRPEPKPAATLIGGNGARLDIATTAPGLQIYNGAHLPTQTGVLDGAANLAPYKGIALEPQYWPDAPNHPHFPQVTLRPGTAWKQKTTFTLSPPTVASH